MKKFKYVSLIIFICSFVFSANAKLPTKQEIINPGGPHCEQDWAKKIKSESAVRFEYEYLDEKGHLLPKEKTRFNENPQQFCSGNLAMLGSGNTKKLKIVSAGHCVDPYFRRTASSNMHSPVKPGPKTGSVRLVAVIPGGVDGSNDIRLNIKSPMGPVFRSTTGDVDESYRKDDFVIADMEPQNNNDQDKKFAAFVKDKTFPSLCDSNMQKEDARQSVVIGYGLTNNGESSTAALCADQKINYIKSGVIAIDPYKKGAAGACPGDSGGGLWVKPNTAEPPCLAGVVSGPKSSTLKQKSPFMDFAKGPSRLNECTKEGVEALYSAVYQQQKKIDVYLTGEQQALPVDEATPSAESGATQK
ncbi:MAG: trypsin-like serine protease [Bdellovibrionaceae bacterium]|nr:trypsin-like serine protease [Pseudobdellovibrionaceae bacterium]